MKKTKIISIVVAMLAVVALGVFMGKYMFKLMEATTTSNTNTQQTTNSNNGNSGVQILYGEKTGEATSPESIPTNNAQEIKHEQQKPSNENPVASETKTVSKPEASNPNSTLTFSPTGPRWYAYASTNGLNVREAPDKKGKLLFKVSKGTRGVVKEKKDGWSMIQWDFNKKKGWSIDEYLVQGPAGIVDNVVNNASGTKIENIKKEQLSQANVEKMLEQNKTIIGVAKPAPASETVITYTNGKDLPKKGTITPANGANIREQPNTQSNRVIKLPKGTIVGIKSVKQVEKYQWFEITFSNGSKTGWTREDNLQF